MARRRTTRISWTPGRTGKASRIPHRAEREEIEGALRQHGEVRDAAVVVAEEANGEKKLVGYVVCQGKHEPSSAELREYLSGKLPAYMVPAVLVTLAELPLTANGKVDRKRLSRIEAPNGSKAEKGEGEPARGAVEELVSGIFCEVLRCGSAGAEGNFFELGGHSLLATQVISRIRESFGIELPMRALFESPTVRALAMIVGNESGPAEADGGRRCARPPGQESARTFPMLSRDCGLSTSWNLTILHIIARRGYVCKENLTRMHCGRHWERS